MADGRIAIVRADTEVAAVTWTGTRAKGAAVVRQVGEGTTGRDLRRAIADRRDLARVRFLTDRGSVPGWSGFDGWLAGLGVVLPALGLAMGAVIWPDQDGM